MEEQPLEAVGAAARRPGPVDRVPGDANALRGEFDAIKLAELVAEVSVDMGRSAAEALLPYTPERMDAMIDMARAGTDFDSSMQRAFRRTFRIEKPPVVIG